MRSAGWRAEGGQKASPRDVLIIKPSSLGDIVHTLPSAAILRQAWPEAKIRWLVNTEWRPLLHGNPHLDEVIDFPRREFRGLAGALRIAPWARSLRARVQPDLILDYQGLFRSAIIAKLCRSETQVLGLNDAREGARLFYDAAADVSGKAHAVDRYLALTEAALGRYGASLPGGDLQWPLPEGSLPARFPAGQPYIVLHPFSRGAGKSLTAAQVADFCRTLSSHTIIVAGQVGTRVELPEMENVSNFLNQTSLDELIHLLRGAAFVVSVDSGPMHIAAALTHRLISIHTWSDPAKVGPYPLDAWVWKDGRLWQRRDAGVPAAQREVANIRELAEFVRSQL